MLLSLICVCGCDTSGPERVVVSGQVTYQGRPVERGTIRFVPTGETRGPATGTTIKQGKYEAAAKGGVLVGTQRVEIIAIALRKDPMGRDLVVLEGAGVQYLPAKYNRQSTLSVTIESGGPVVQDFDLK